MKFPPIPINRKILLFLDNVFKRVRRRQQIRGIYPNFCCDIFDFNCPVSRDNQYDEKIIERWLQKSYSHKYVKNYFKIKKSIPSWYQLDSTDSPDKAPPSRNCPRGTTDTEAYLKSTPGVTGPNSKSSMISTRAKNSSHMDSVQGLQNDSEAISLIKQAYIIN